MWDLWYILIFWRGILESYVEELKIDVNAKDTNCIMHVEVLEQYFEMEELMDEEKMI